MEQQGRSYSSAVMVARVDQAGMVVPVALAEMVETVDSEQPGQLELSFCQRVVRVVPVVTVETEPPVDRVAMAPMAELAPMAATFPPTPLRIRVPFHPSASLLAMAARVARVVTEELAASVEMAVMVPLAGLAVLDLQG